MIQSENGPVLPNNSFGMLLSFHLTIMLFYADKQGRGKRKVEYVIPFFDDLDFAAKTATLYQLTLCLFDPDAELLPENVYTASALAALENFVQESVRQEVEMRHWYKKKYGEEEHAVRSMVLTAYQSRFPHDECPDENSHDVSAFQCAASRLFSEIRPKPYYWLVEGLGYYLRMDGNDGCRSRFL